MNSSQWIEVWISLEHNIMYRLLLLMNGEIVSMFLIAQLANILINFIAGSWKSKQLLMDKVSAKVSEM